MDTDNQLNLKLDPDWNSIMHRQAYVLLMQKDHTLDETVAVLSSKMNILPYHVHKSVKPIFETIHTHLETFWNKRLESGRYKHPVVINKNKCLDFAYKLGFCRFKDSSGFKFVQVRHKIIEEVELTAIQRTFKKYIDELPLAFDDILKTHLQEAWLDEYAQICDNKFMQHLPLLNDQLLKANAHTAYFYFQNGFVEVNKRDIKLKPYNDLPGYILKSQIIERDFKIKEEEEVTSNSEFYQFCEKVTGHNDERFMVLINALGYLMHLYKAKDTPVAIILYDKVGRTGKGIIGQALKQMTKVLYIDGRNVDVNNRFILQGYSPGVNIIYMDDVNPKRLPFDRILTWLTEGITAEKKNKGADYIPFEEAPKFLITSNYVFEGISPSHEGRRVEIELAPYYNLDFTPVIDFGHQLFTDWDEQQWLLFDNMLLLCCQSYLAEGIKRYKSPNMFREKIIQATNEEFVIWAEKNLVQLDEGKELDKKELWFNFLEVSGYPAATLYQGKFTRWIKAYLKGYGYEFKDDKSHGGVFRYEALVITQVPSPASDKSGPGSDK